MKSREIKSKWLKNLLCKATKLYSDYIPVKDIFVEPKLVCKIGRWRRDNCLPVWRRGPTVRTYKDWKNVTQVFVEFPKKTYLSKWKTVWTKEFKQKHPIRSLLKPSYTLPIWLSFFKFNHGMMWKTKWDDYRFEFPPQFTLVFFGLSISFWLVQDEFYWESILYYTDPCSMSGKSVYDKSLPEFKEDIEGVGKRLGIWNSFKDGKFYALDSSFLKSPCKERWEKFMKEHPVDSKKTRKKK